VERCVFLGLPKLKPSLITLFQFKKVTRRFPELRNTSTGIALPTSLSESFLASWSFLIEKHPMKISFSSLAIDLSVH
jgi:hypothetical protein